MSVNRKKSIRGSIGMNTMYRSSSIQNNGAVNIRVDDDSGKEPLLERMLRFKSTDSLFRCPSENDDDHDLASLLEFPFSDDEGEDEYQNKMAIIRQPVKVEELQKLLDDEDNAFSEAYQEILKEIDDEKGPFSLPCSTCSLCSSCTTDTWDRLNITDDCLEIKPTPLTVEEIEELDKVKNEHSDSINTLLSNMNFSGDDDEDDYSSTSSMAIPGKQEFDGRRLSDRKQSVKAHLDSYEQYMEQTEPWTDSLTNYEDFFISPLDYDYYYDVKSRDKLVERDTIPWSVKERSRNKCTKWLDNYYF